MRLIPTRHGAARALSIAGHPGLLVPVTLAASAVVAGRSAQTALLGAAIGAGLSAAVFAFCLWRVRGGAWQHIDGSRPRERLELNAVLLLVLFGASAFITLAGGSAFVALGLAFSGAIVTVAVLLRRRMNLSLHVAFAAFAGSLLWPNRLAVGAGAAFALGVAWSRLELGRHRPIEVQLGLLVGVVSGVLMEHLLARLPP